MGYQIMIDCSAKTKDDAVALLQEKLSYLRSTEWDAQWLGTSGHGQTAVVYAGDGHANPLQGITNRLLALETIAKNTENAVSEIWDAHYERRARR